MKRVFLLMLSFLACVTNAQNVRYISDEVDIPLRAGPSDRYRINKVLKTGTKVNVLEENKTTGYIRVRKDNYEGWIHISNLMNEPSAKNYIKEAKEQYEPARLKVVALEKELTTMKEKEKQLLSNIEMLEKKARDSEEQLAIFKRSNLDKIQLDKKNQQLVADNVTLQKDLDSLKKTKEMLEKNANSWEQVMSASILLFGIFLGLVVIPRLATRRKKTNDYDYY